MIHPASTLLCSCTLVFAGVSSLFAADPPTNVKLNSDGTSQLHNEEQIAVNPTQGKNVVAVWRDFRLGYRRVGVGVSHDGGASWSDSLLSDSAYPRASDPGICADAEGNFYAHVLSLNNSGGIAGVAISVFKSTDGGDHWSAPVDAVTSSFGGLDKQMIACDRSGGPTSGYLHLAWYNIIGGIRTTCSIDGGASFPGRAPGQRRRFGAMAPTRDRPERTGLHRLAQHGRGAQVRPLE